MILRTNLNEGRYIMKINPGRIMNSFIEVNKRQYAIPVYQRNYTWAKDQCEKLFSDIISASKKDVDHFCGSIIYSLVKVEKSINYYIIIDGQQRMTTIYLLLKALITEAPTKQEKENVRKMVINTDAWDPYSIDQASKLKLKPIKSDNNQLLLIMDDKFDEVDKDSDIWKNYDLFCHLVREKLDEGVTIHQIYYGIEKLICVDIQLDDQDNAQEIFERINSTGVPLSLSDKIRNFILMVDADQERLYEEYWLSIEKLVDKDNLTSFFLSYLNLKVDGFPKENDAYDRFKQLFKEDEFTNESMLAELHHYAKLYHLFTCGDKRYSLEVNKYLRELQLLKQTTLFTFLYRVFDDFEANVFDEKELCKILKMLLHYSVRRIVCEVGSNSLRGLYKTLYTRVFNKEENKEHYYDSIVSFMNQLTSKDAIPTDEEFISSLKQKNIYRKSVVCKYILDAVENQGKEEVNTKSMTIEHVMPQNKNMSTSWQKMLGEDWERVKDTYLHTLGNLTLTGYNSELSDSSYAEKKQEFFDTDATKIKTLNKEIFENDIWNETIIVERANRLSSIINKLFTIEESGVVVDYSDPRFKIYSCDNCDIATGKTPNYFIFNGEKIICDTWAEMLKIVINRLYNQDPTIIQSMALEEDTLYDAMYPFFTYDSKKLPKSEHIRDTKIYHRAGFSAATIIFIIKKLMNRYEIEYKDFEYSAKEYASDK